MRLVCILFDCILIFICVSKDEGCAQPPKLQDWEVIILKIVGTRHTRLVTVHNAKLEKLIFDGAKKIKI
jgi:hypothetical protein